MTRCSRSPTPWARLISSNPERSERRCAERWVDVPPERLSRWFENFAARNGGGYEIGTTGEGARAVAADGTVAQCVVPFAASWARAEATEKPVAAMAAHAGADRTVGVLLVRLGGHAAGVFSGGTLRESKVGSRHVQGRSAAGGWSQQRFARRRAQQADQALDAAVEVAARILLPARAELAGLVLGGERRAVERVLADRRLSALGTVPTEPRFLTVPDPRQDVLLSTPPMFRAVRISLRSCGGAP